MSTTKRRVARTCRVEVIADAPVESVWRVVAADVRRAGGDSRDIDASDPARAGM
jgi:hypothetical protein